MSLPQCPRGAVHGQKARRLHDCGVSPLSDVAYELVRSGDSESLIRTPVGPPRQPRAADRDSSRRAVSEAAAAHTAQDPALSYVPWQLLVASQ